jgi:hypothetical protein
MGRHCIKIFLFLLIAHIGILRAGADTLSVAIDTTEKVAIENVLDSSLIKKIALNPDFQYKQEEIRKSPIKEMWENIMLFFFKVISKIAESLFGIKVSKTTSTVIFWVFILIILAAIGWFFFRTKRQILTDSGLSIADVDEISIENLSYTDEYNRAYQNQNYKPAIRFLLLHTIKFLDEEGIIKYIPGKTLYEYQYEIKNQDIRSKFAEICYVYEYVWFGNFDATKSMCDLVNDKMIQLTKNQQR